MAQLIVKNVSQSYESEEGKVLALKNINLEIKEGEFLALIGPSGCGKSTLLRIIAGLIEPTEGEVLMNGQKVVTTIPSISFIFQNFALFPWLNVFENVAFPLKMLGVKESKIKSQTAEIIKEVGLTGFEKSHPKQLSGGMRQRVGIARALVGDSKIILADEPFSSLDAFTAKTLRDELLKIFKRYKKTIVMVTHLVDEAAYMADRIVVLTPRPGKIEKIIQNKLSRPRNTRDSKFYDLTDELTRIIHP
ncbi:ABC transporter ATP-binding protein [Candidatus Curtissbacteria bacterium]|nr:ABC transporter ATP-binding protein [Candidatus Curtissbacteria bacterium]